MAKSYRPGDVKIHSMTLWSMDRSRSVSNIMGQVKSVKIYESIMDPVMTAVFTIADSIGLAESFPIIGEEYIEMDLETPGMGEIFTYRFDVLDVRDRMQAGTDKTKIYNLFCASKEFRKNVRMLHDVHNEAVPVEVVSKILKESLNTDKQFSAGEGVYAKVDLDLTKLRPLEAIDKTRLLTRNVQEQSSAFCFFENKHGFNFFSVEQMFKNGKTKIGDKVFFFDGAVNHSIYENNFRRVLGMTVMNDSSPVRGALAGQLNAKIKTFDIITGEVVEKQYKDSESNSSFIYADDDNAPLRSSTGQNEDGAEPSAYLLNITDSSKADPNIHEMTLERSSYVSKLIQQLYRIEVYGDLGISAGDVIEVNLPNTSGLTQNDEKLDPRFNGNFLVSRLVNNISLQGPRPTHSVTCEIIKGNLRA